MTDATRRNRSKSHGPRRARVSAERRPTTSARVVDLDAAARAIERFLVAVGAPVGSDPELVGTGRRVAEAFALDLLSGYRDDPAAILREATASPTRGLVVVTGLSAATICPHHLLPAMGVVHVGYLPGARVVGLGALGRLVDCFSRRLTLQEDLGQSVADALVEHLGAVGAGCVVDMVPACVVARGERRHGARAYTVAVAGAMATDPRLRAELLAAVPRAGTGS
jgi:GTP cyclohydrolase I